MRELLKAVNSVLFNDEKLLLVYEKELNTFFLKLAGSRLTIACNDAVSMAQILVNIYNARTIHTDIWANPVRQNMIKL